jgi:hypothetical protein
MGHRFKQVDRAAALPQNRLPLPPRAPAIPLSEQRAISRPGSIHPGQPPISATVPKASWQPPREPAPSLDLPVEFWAEEPVSFDRRLTPVVPAFRPENHPAPSSAPAAKRVAVAPRSRPSWAWARLGQPLFLVTLFAAVMLLCHVISVVYHVPWLDPQPLFDRWRPG